MDDNAAISECGKYRYRLTRRIKQPVRWVKPCLFIMLNPSTADANQDDPTIRRCISFAKSWGCTSLTVVNLFDYRATDPKSLPSPEIAESQYCDGYIEDEVDKHKLGVIVAAWGSQKIAKCRGEYVANHFGPFLCLGKTRDGSPRHPLYVKKDKQLEPWP